ncbi:unnamed protein product [Tetraodon nigroviridis]|uniref:(spotted green pufferfish) hypothetical protein n=1 Tax=Tetraodon nigroviridis TaxID=99883 RepID=Q4T9H0_TETNG|nr:unnamed protein product [Tetraodon nigroviridis]
MAALATASRPLKHCSTKLLDGGLPAEVKALDSFLQRTGGLCGGWDQYDHQAFLTAWTKHSGQPAYRKEAKLQLPAKTLEEMERHEEWHQELLHLQDRKRQVGSRGCDRNKMDQSLPLAPWHHRPSSAGGPGGLRSVRRGYRVSRDQKQEPRGPRTKPSSRSEAAVSVVMVICHAAQSLR